MLSLLLLVAVMIILLGLIIGLVSRCGLKTVDGLFGAEKDGLHRLQHIGELEQDGSAHSWSTVAGCIQDSHP